MLNLDADKPFLRKLGKLLKRVPSLNEKISVTFDLLQENPFTPSLKTHALVGNLKGLYSCSAAPDIRIIFTLSGDTVHLLNIGSHDEVY
ncbi:type II toxin-antitoxin system RelE/ParE family toxin [Candidatus Magnetominusculus xianensis]|uniref:Plasmid stabilization protein n=1 Tax=Candidatus Magnetominusculus xianensis TaxID=1748249 RepID=A0ABR5SK22_9BACT|nr:type II toxin-antitoxin system mRNA interferase toxin, RelE/StbE family [Candidatus Magnetominusculus xianensis]KWT87641.1 plasmid stabilization protein [Candidatus Magnetominusculus xianensis]MBF0405670.1 type II toxin-antitoxin system mRNA interferase toxin, RelE/StbE family [Nitrospirota bacterium]